MRPGPPSASRSPPRPSSRSGCPRSRSSRPWRSRRLAAGRSPSRGQLRTADGNAATSRSRPWIRRSAALGHPPRRPHTDGRRRGGDRPTSRRTRRPTCAVGDLDPGRPRGRDSRSCSSSTRSSSRSPGLRQGRRAGPLPASIAGASVEFIHLEPYRYPVVTPAVLEGTLQDPKLTEPAEAWGVGAAPWGVKSMPWIFVVDGDGIVRAKYQGIVGSDDVDVIVSRIDPEPLTAGHGAVRPG